MKICITLLIFNFYLISAFEIHLENPCISKIRCNECIQTPTCAWCFKTDFRDSKRCFQPSVKNICPDEFIENPMNEQSLLMNLELSSIVKNHQSSWFSSFSSDKQEHRSRIVQIQPQEMKLKLRQNAEHSIQFNYSLDEDHAVDIYYIMDLNKEMLGDRYALAKLGELLEESIRNITSNYRLGLGTFFGKVGSLPNETSVENQSSLFRHVISLSTNTANFRNHVYSLPVSDNDFHSDGGLKALIQAMSCNDVIGWRTTSHKIIIFATNLGIRYSNNEQIYYSLPSDLCSMLKTSSVRHPENYSNILQVDEIAKQNKINIIFVVPPEQVSIYSEVKERITGASVGILSENSSNVIAIIKDQYDKITSSVEIKDTSSTPIKITYWSKCLGEHIKETNQCRNLKIGDTVTFTATIEITKCPKIDDWNQVLLIYPVGVNENIKIDLEMLCDCSCEKPGHPMFQTVAPECHGNGLLQCGICVCDNLHFGRRCECGLNDIYMDTYTNNCRYGNQTFDCSGRGQCICGVCECNTRDDSEEVISGKYCECDNLSCDRHDGVLCSGHDHGNCICGVCVCQEGWTGTDCSCSSSNDTCIMPGSTDVCSGQGECRCGTCSCNQKEPDKRWGRYCESSHENPNRCGEFKECVQCLISNATNCSGCPFKPIIVEELSTDGHICSFSNENKCHFQFTYGYQDNNLVIKAKQPKCSPKGTFTTFVNHLKFLGV